MSCERCKDWQDQGLSDTCPSCDMAEEDELQYCEGYMCGIDWQHELGEAPGGTKVYMSPEDLIKNHSCAADSCGIVKVRVQLLGWEKPQDLFSKAVKYEKK